MQFGLFLNTEYPHGESVAERFDEHLEQVRVARESGFDSIHVGQHYSIGGSQWLPPIPTLARVIAETGDMRISTSILLLSLHHPVDLAERIAMLDILSKGRFDFGVGSGWSNQEFEALGIPRKERVGRFVEGLSLMKRLWTEENVTFEGKYYQVRDLTLSIRPVQKPYPPIWAAASSEPAVRRAAQLADAWILSSHIPIDKLEEHVAIYRDALAESGKPFPPKDFPLLRSLYVAEDREKAIREAGPFIESSYKLFGDWGLFEEVVQSGKKHLDFQELLRGRVIIGDPEDCITEIEHYREKLGTNYLVIRVQWLGMEQEKVLNAIRLFGEKVIPHFKQQGGSS